MQCRRIGLCLLGISLIAGTANATEMQTTGKLTYVGTGVSGEGLYVIINVALGGGCTGGGLGQGAAFMATSAPQYKETFSTMLLALAQGKAITLTYASGNCASSKVQIMDAVSVGP